MTAEKFNLNQKLNDSLKESLNENNTLKEQLNRQTSEKKTLQESFNECIKENYNSKVQLSFENKNLQGRIQESLNNYASLEERQRSKTNENMILQDKTKR